MQMQNAATLSPDRIREFLKLSREIEFTAQNRAEVYAWVQRTLVAREYARQGKKRRGRLRAYIKKVTGLSLPRIARLVRMYRATGILELKAQPSKRAVEMPGPWKAWKTESRFPTLPTAPWKSRRRREISTFPQPGFAPDGKVENQKQVSHFPTRGSRR